MYDIDMFGIFLSVFLQTYSSHLTPPHQPRWICSASLRLLCTQSTDRQLYRNSVRRWIWARKIKERTTTTRAKTRTNRIKDKIKNESRWNGRRRLSRLVVPRAPRRALNDFRRQPEAVRYGSQLHRLNGMAKTYAVTATVRSKWTSTCRPVSAIFL